ncbi:3-hydroxyacyl-CoA dehydrogenase NAD-binding domain-containing protein [Acidiferrobacter sp.]|uniref:3-hydroxyacyl-CoA dehydrogenase NAD-binding domain-containing protein n=1 Tax=Acidiferrobacter sp. TaxID=1872107 RepID=UPI002637C11F|nr:3-hydroxyacyl-CoA dehydrogenase NAD-binding domain-containing protein [Acidiferrobacter sp.]
MTSSWTLSESDDIAELVLNVPDKRHNVLSWEVVGELDQVLAILETRSLRGLVIRSGKPQGFAVGADVHEFRRVLDAARAAELTRAGQMVLARLARLPYPSVAIIHGPCLGGGLELALACSYRVACDDDHTSLALPEVKLGIHPGFGGTIRLPALIGPLPALSMMLTGRGLTARKAHKAGLVDECVPQRYLDAAARTLLRDVPPKGRAPWYKKIPSAPFLRPYVGAYMQQRLKAKVDCRHYPAPCRIVSLWARQGSFEAEALSCAELLVTPASRHLVALFELSEDLKRRARAHAHGIRHIHVIGAGVMGAEIAAWATLKGFQVSLQDRAPEVLARGIKRAHGLLAERLKGRAAEAARDRLMPDMRGAALPKADLVIEAIIENREAKHALFAQIEARVPDRTIIATNTSSIPLDDLAAGLSAPGRLVGLHFFNPVSKMPLIEVIGGMATTPTALAAMRSLAVALDRLPVDVKSSPGFLVNRVLMPYLLEAVVLAEEGVALADIDAAAVDFGMPMGPIALADTVGLDICLAVAQTLSAPLGLQVPDLLARKVEAGLLGKKSGRGFYHYPRPRTFVRARPPTDPAIGERLIMRLVNEAGRCLRHGIVAGPDMVDIGLVYGTGFAPFRGGPLGYAEALGAGEIASRLTELAERYGPRFAPDPVWSQEGVLARPPRDL